MMDQWTDRLSEYLDDELSPDERAALEVHLRECAECMRTLQELRQVVARAAQLHDREPEHDLWSGIAARINAGEPEAVTAVHATSTGKRRVSFSIPQLVAASIVLVLMSAGSMYLLFQREQAGAPTVAQNTPARPVNPTVRAVTRNYDDAVEELESVLERNRDQLDTATVRILEQNLAIIDRAILDARAALGQEPSNPYLGRYLDQAMQKKVQLLQRATKVMRAET